MCTVVILRRPEHAWPVILGANRDEMVDRPWSQPARHWPDRADVVAGRDELAGGTWMGLNDNGVVACILNRHGSLGPAPGKRSRGELALEALDHADAAAAADALSDISPSAYRPFNLVIADNASAWWLALASGANGSEGSVQTRPIPDGLSMFTAFDRNDKTDTRIASFLPSFEAATPPDPDENSWSAWKTLLASTETHGEPYHAMSFRTDSGFGTSSSSLLALPSVEVALGDNAKRPIGLFAAGRPDSAPFHPVDFGAPTR
ncbi:MAG: NRDE family protein [Rhodospirillaceae bacterium]